MSYASLPKGWDYAAVVFVQERIVSRYAEQSEQNREAIYRDARRVRQQIEESESVGRDPIEHTLDVFPAETR